jgi:hypothetical protein
MKKNRTSELHLLRNVYHDKIKDFRHNLQIIPIGTAYIPQFIKATFDLEICQNYFDGERIYIKNINKLIIKYDQIRPNTKFMLSFYLSDKDDSENNTLKRIKKYTERGFDIIRHPQYDIIQKEINDIIIAGYEVSDKYYNIYQHIISGEIDLSRY